MLPRGSAIVGAEESLAHDRVNPLTFGAGSDCYTNASTWITRQALFTHMLPGRACVRGFEDLRLARWASLVELGWKSISSSVKYSSIVRRRAHVEHEGFIVFEEYFVPCAPAVGRLEDSAGLTRHKRTKCRDDDVIRIFGINNYGRNVQSVLQTNIRPSGAAVC